MDVEELAAHVRRFHRKQVAVVPTAAFLQMHLLMERHLRELLLERAPNPEPLRDLRVKLEGRARVAFALGLIEPEIYESLLYLDEVRNQLVHRLDYKIDHSVGHRLGELVGLGDLPDAAVAGGWEAKLYIALDTLHMWVLQAAKPDLTINELTAALKREWEE